MRGGRGCSLGEQPKAASIFKLTEKTQGTSFELFIEKFKTAVKQAFLLPFNLLALPVCHHVKTATEYFIAIILMYVGMFQLPYEILKIGC